MLLKRVLWANGPQLPLEISKDTKINKEGDGTVVAIVSRFGEPYPVLSIGEAEDYDTAVEVALEAVIDRFEPVRDGDETEPAYEFSVNGVLYSVDIDTDVAIIGL